MTRVFTQTFTSVQYRIASASPELSESSQKTWCLHYPTPQYVFPVSLSKYDPDWYMHWRLRLQIFITRGTKAKTGSQCTEERQILYLYILTARGESQVCPLRFTPARCLHVHVWVHESSESDPDAWKRNSSIRTEEYQNWVWYSKMRPVGGTRVLIK